MNNEIQTFNNVEFGKIRVELIEEETWFIAKDICKALDLRNITETLKRLDEDELSITEVIDSIGRKQKMYIVNESGLYNLILQSRKDGAKQFRKWITGEVIPSLRKTGGYIVGQKDMTDREKMAKAILIAQTEIEEREKRLKEAKPKLLLADTLMVAKKGDIYIREMAKILTQAGYKIGEKGLFEELREKGFLISKKGLDYNTPTQKSIDLGVIRIKKGTYYKNTGETFEYKTPLITSKGQVYFLNYFLGKTTNE